MKKRSSDRRLKTMISLYATPEQVKALRALSAKTRVPQAVYLREAVDYVLEKHGGKESTARGSVA